MVLAGFAKGGEERARVLRCCSDRTTAICVPMPMYICIYRLKTIPKFS